MYNPQDTVLDLMYGRWRTQTMDAGLKLGVFDAVGDEARPAAEVAGELDVDAALLYRLLRALAALGLLSEQPGQAFAVTEAGAFLKKDHPQSLRDIILLREAPEHTAVWKYLPEIVREGVQNGFVREYGRPAFEHAARDAGYGQAFDAGMSSYSRLQTEWVLEALRDYDFSAVRQVCDIGGGHGHLLCHLLLSQPHLSGTVLERAGALGDRHSLWAERLKIADR